MEKKKMEFSKFLLAQESVLIWIMTLSFIVLAFYCISLGFMGTLPWLAAMVGCPWAAYAVSQTFYYKKAAAENTTGGLKYEATLAEINKTIAQYEDASGFDFDYNFEQPYVASENVDEYQI